MGFPSRQETGGGRKGGGGGRGGEGEKEGGTEAGVPCSGPIIVTDWALELSYCVVNTDGRELLLACLAAIEATHPAGVEREVLVLDNASADGSARAVRALGGGYPADRAREAGRQGGERFGC